MNLQLPLVGFNGSHFHDYEFVCICSIQGFSRQKYLHISSPDVVEVVVFRLPLCYRMNPPTSPSSYCCQRFCCGLLTVRLDASSSSSSSTIPPSSGLTLFYLLFLCSSLFSFFFLLLSPLLFFFPACCSPGSDPGSPKKCRARFGLNQQTDWCGPCRWVPEHPLTLRTVTFTPSISPLLRACITSSPPPSDGLLSHADVSHGQKRIGRCRASALEKCSPLRVVSHRLSALFSIVLSSHAGSCILKEPKKTQVHEHNI